MEYLMYIDATYRAGQIVASHLLGGKAEVETTHAARQGQTGIEIESVTAFRYTPPAKPTDYSLMLAAGAAGMAIDRNWDRAKTLTIPLGEKDAGDFARLGGDLDDARGKAFDLLIGHAGKVAKVADVIKNTGSISHKQVLEIMG